MELWSSLGCDPGLGEFSHKLKRQLGVNLIILMLEGEKITLSQESF